MDAVEWIARYAERVGLSPPTEDEFGQILELAGIAAHASERVAAPVACWLAAASGLTLGDALDAAREIAPGD